MKNKITSKEESGSQTRRSVTGERLHIIPHSFYADVAPLPIPLAEYQLCRFLKISANISPQETFEQFLSEVQLARETAFEILDDFVRNRHRSVPSDLRLSTEWLTKTLAAYDPSRTMPATTFKHWQKRGIIRMDAHGKPSPGSAAAVLMIRMMDRHKENIFPETLSSYEADYWCHVIEMPESPYIQVLPLHLLSCLPASAIVWTPWPGAAWEENQWHLIGEHEANSAAIRFAGVKLVRGTYWWDVNLEDLIRWDAQAASLYIPLSGQHERQIQDLANVILNRLFAERVPIWNKQEKHISKRLFERNRTNGQK